MPRLLALVALTALVLAISGPVAAEAPQSPSVSVMHGFVDQSSMTLWVQTEREARVAVTVQAASDASGGRRVEGVTRADDDFALHLRLVDLVPGTRYRYEITFDGGRAADTGSFTTQPRLLPDADPPDFSVAIGSCAYLTDALDRPGPPLGGGYEIFDSIAAKRPDFMLWLGDNVYFREPELASLAGMSARYRAYRTAPALRTLLRATAHAAIWDDHDFGPNDSDGSFAMKDAALAAFKRYWTNPSYGLPNVPGVFGKLAWGDVDFFLLDDRYHRYPNHHPPTPDKVMFGAAQLDWLKQSLIDSRATFKLIVAGGQMWNSRNRYESFLNYPAESRALAQWLADRRIEGLLFLSGDRHFSELLRIERSGIYPLYEFSSSPLTSRPFVNLSAAERANPEAVPSTIVTERSFGMLRFAGARNARTVALEAYSTSGELLWQRRIAAAELR